MKKKGVLLVILLLLSIIRVSAQLDFDAGRSYSWLISQSNNGNYGNDIVTTAFATLALRSSGQTKYSDLGYDWIKSQEDETDHCWPKGGCKVKETAFALLVLNEYGDDISEGEMWLEKSLASGLNGKWLLQTITSNSGTCRVSYQKNGENIEKNVKVEEGRFPECSNTPDTLFDLNRCLENDLLKNNPGIEIDINCNELGPSTVISVVYNEESSFYLIQEATTTRQLIRIENGCFGTTAKGICNLDSTLLTNWVLFNLASDLKTFLWLRDNYDKLNAMQNGLMYSSTDDKIKDAFLNDLKKLQRNDGSFDRNVIDTSYAILALKKAGTSEELGKAMEWLGSKQGSDGSFEGSALKTAIALYSGFTGGDIIVVPPIIDDFPIDDGKPDDVCNNDGVCDVSFGEDSNNCKSDCSCGDDVCDNIEYVSGSCEEDCKTGDEVSCGNDVKEGDEECDGTDDYSCPGMCLVDCVCGEKESSFSFGWILFVIIILVIGGGAFFVFKKKGFLNKGSKTTSRSTFQPPFRMETSNRPVPPGYSPPQPRVEKRSKIEDELEKSLEEAKKLLKKF